MFVFPHQNGTYYGYDCESPVWKRPIHNCQSQYQKALTVVDSFGNLTFYNIILTLTAIHVYWYKNIKPQKIKNIFKYEYIYFNGFEWDLFLNFIKPLIERISLGQAQME